MNRTIGRATFSFPLFSESYSATSRVLSSLTNPSTRRGTYVTTLAAFSREKEAELVRRDESSCCTSARHDRLQRADSFACNFVLSAPIDSRSTAARMESIGRPRGCDHDEPFVLGICRAAAKRENAESPRSLIDERAAINQSIEGTRSTGRSSFVEVIKFIEPSSAVHRRRSLRPRYRANVSCLFSHREKRLFFLEACSSRCDAASTTTIFFIAGAFNARSCYFATCLRLKNSNFPRFSDITPRYLRVSAKIWFNRFRFPVERP